MTDDEKSLGDQNTFDGETPGKVDADSFGDQMTYVSRGIRENVARRLTQ